ncbi:MAG: DNA topoisomerase [Cereibacter sphaeroides]|uniref:DNA topoisomerase n=1 Tax=Cereibacter sphaeroides TaxID=1063 RepID=A0A2W5SF26_CERSP|nr:MAG: DNA topoisomerase [Cereibacter sphaeroides]
MRTKTDNTEAHSLPDGLTYYPDNRPGIRREKRGHGFSYVAPDGTRIDRGPERQRLERMAVPPAYSRVWMSPLVDGHLMATGFDQRERKQYRYHPAWAGARSDTKYASLANFGHALPRIRRWIMRDLETEAGELQFGLAAVALLIDRLSLRAGNECYTRDNGSYGALTLQRRHLRFTKDGLRLLFKAKGGKMVRRAITDKTLMRALQKARDLPGASLLSWIDEHGTVQSIGSAALNSYLSDAADHAVTAKTFRTWAGTRAAFETAETGGASIKDIAQAAADALHNTPAIARSSYIHPKVIDLAGAEPLSLHPNRIAGLTASEARLLRFLEGG